MNFRWNVFSSRRPDGSAPEATKLESKPPFLHPELPDRVRALGSRLGLHELVDCACVRSVVVDASARVTTKHKDAIERADSLSTEVSHELHRVLGLREACKVLAGKTYKTHVHHAIDASDPMRRHEIFAQAVRLLEPEDKSCEQIDPAAFLDPSTWPVESIPVRSRYEIHLRLSLVVTAMLCQETGIEKANHTVGHVVLDAVRRRIQRNAEIEAELARECSPLEDEREHAAARSWV